MSTLDTALKIHQKALSMPNDPEALEYLFEAVKALESEDFERAHELNKDVRRLAAGGVRTAKDIGRMERFYRQLKMGLLYDSRICFDSYMQYLEFDRENNKKFYIPRRKVLRPVVKSMQSLVDDDLDLLTVSLPPGTGKTTLKIFLLSWYMGKNPDKPSLDSAHSGMMTGSTYEGVLQVLRDPEYLWKDVFPEVKNIITNAKEQTIDLNKKHRFSTLTCRAIGASLTGATRCEGLLTADDLCSGIEQAMSADRMDKLWEQYTNDLKSRKKLGAKELHTATRWSVKDVIGRLDTMYFDDERSKFIIIPALNDEGESNFNYSHGVGFDTKFFDDMKESLDDASFRALYMNQPIEREGILYHEDELQRYFELPDMEPDSIIAVCDTKDTGKDFQFLPIAIQFGENYYIEDCICNNYAIEVLDEQCADILVKYKVKWCQFESNSAGGRVADRVLDKVKERGGHTHITKKFTTANKETKILVNSPFVKQRFLFKDSSQYRKDSDYARMIKFMCGYTLAGRNRFDDVPDGLSQLSEFIQSLSGNQVAVFRRPF